MTRYNTHMQQLSIQWIQLDMCTYGCAAHICAEGLFHRPFTVHCRVSVCKHEQHASRPIWPKITFHFPSQSRHCVSLRHGYHSHFAWASGPTLDPRASAAWCVIQRRFCSWLELSELPPSHLGFRGTPHVVFEKLQSSSMSGRPSWIQPACPNESWHGGPLSFTLSKPSCLRNLKRFICLKHLEASGSCMRKHGNHKKSDNIISDHYFTIFFPFLVTSELCPDPEVREH